MDEKDRIEAFRAQQGRRAEAVLAAREAGSGARTESGPLLGGLRHGVLALREQAVAAVAEIDVELLALLQQRRALVHRVRVAEDALHGSWRAEHRRRQVPPAELVPVVPRVREVLRGLALRVALVELLEALARASQQVSSGSLGQVRGGVSDGDLTVEELVQLLGQQGYGVAGRASQTVSNALQVEVRAGRVVKTGHGRYRSADHR